MRGCLVVKFDSYKNMLSSLQTETMHGTILPKSLIGLGYSNTGNPTEKVINA